MDLVLRNKLVEDNINLIHFTIHKLVNTEGYRDNILGSYDDLFQTGALALINATSAYDGDIANFSTFACAVVKYAVQGVLKKKSNRLNASRLSVILEDNDDESFEHQVEDVKVRGTEEFEVKKMELLERLREKDPSGELETVLILSYEGYSVTDISKIMKKSYQHIRTLNLHIKKIAKEIF